MFFLRVLAAEPFALFLVNASGFILILAPSFVVQVNDSDIFVELLLTILFMNDLIRLYVHYVFAKRNPWD